MKKLLFLLIGLLVLAGCKAKENTAVEEADAQLATRVSIFSSKDNKKEWVLHADSVNFENTQSATLKNPRLLLERPGQGSATVSGNLGAFDYERQLVTIEGNAILESITQHARITAHRFFYDIAKDRIWSDGKTIITRGSARSVAINGVETDSKLKRISIKKHATQLPKNREELQGNLPNENK